MKSTLVLSISVLMAAAPLSAQRGGSPKPPTSHGAPAPKPVHVTAPHGGSAPHASAPKVAHGSPVPKAGQATHGGGHVTTKTKVHSSPVKATKTTSSVKTKTTTKTARSTSTTPTLGTTTTLSPVQQKLQKNTNLASKLQSRLPAGTDLTLASAGFRNLGQFVAAVNVSNNLGIPFSQLKTRMVDQGMSLGQAIQDARPQTTDTVIVVHRAENDADVLIRSTDQTTVKSKNKKAAKGSSGGN